MHIAWLGKKSPFCGNVTYGREVTNALLDRGHRVSFLHFAHGEDPTGELGARETNPNLALEPSLTCEGGTCGEVSIPCLYKSQIYTIPSPRSSRVLTEALHRLNPDVVHASLTLSPLDFRLPDICEELGLPLVATFHPPFDHKLRNLTSGTQHLTYQLYAPALARYDRVIVFSEIQRDLLIRLGMGSDRLQVIPNGVDVSRYCPGPATLKEDLGVDRLFVYQGRIAPEKNVESLLKAWKSLNFPPSCRLLIVGDGPLKASLELFYGSEDQGITWWGFEASDRRRIEILQSADVFILPSLVEGLSLSLLEAMACGTACLATDVGADGEVLERGAGIVLSPQRTISQLQTLLPLFQDQPEMAGILGQKARQRVLERYTLKGNITQLEALYQDLWRPLGSYPHVQIPGFCA
ncbi:glycosyltransferase family 4 protein [Prochlorothrix hollandica]|uniref:Glycosyltransferase n=1 Tax=Prochlorothrix hollandica PCC 9006 = CALU 1027 TaxID=317619 RepID=A0A0M2Q2V7_PROHO|nr:glycosyltransferase family 4 protein [Prochlorothrix hollandica]KKJ01593.1 glycosyltransferase [Prochlorothrix hollandica PCC 9006 = CALU 1027]